MYLLRQDVNLFMIERQSLDLTSPIEVVIHILGTLDHHDLLAIPYLRLYHYFRMSVDDAIRSSYYLRLNIVLLLAAEGNVLDGHELIPRMYDPNPNENLVLILIPILDLKLVIDLLAMIDLLYEDVSFIEDIDWVACLVSDDVMRDELQWLNFLLFEEVLFFLLLRLLLPACHCLVDADEDLP